jgi:NAD(P)-dependent dehydrogenase (short-subunit alcohol dehydrogenase family)
MSETKLFSLDGEVAVVIGGGGVLAGAMAEGLAKAGARVAVAGRTRENAEKRAQAITAAGHEAIGVQCDSTSKADVERLLATVIERFGRVDILVNAAGVNSATPFSISPRRSGTASSIST